MSWSAILILGIPVGICMWALVLQEQRDEARTESAKVRRLSGNYQTWRK